MIKKFWGKNFGVLKDFSVRLEPLTLLVGPNASGKTTFLRALRVLAMLTRTPLYGREGLFPLGYRATIGDFLSPHDLNRKLTIGVEVESDLGSGEYEITIGYDNARRVKVQDERVNWESKSGDSFNYNSSTPPFQFDYRGVKLSSELPRESTLPYLCFRYRSAPEWTRQLAPLYQLTNSFTPFHVFRFSPSEISRPVPPGREVSHNGAGLAAELDRLLGEERREFDRLTSNLKQIFAHVKEIKVTTIQGRNKEVLKGLVFERQDGVQVPGELESDGVLLTLAHLWLSTRKHPAFGIEEPETATYPSLLESRFSLLRSLSEGQEGHGPIQVLATTHSSLLLTAAQDTSLVRVFEPQQDGSSRIYAPQEEFMQDLIYRRLGWATGTEK